MKPCLKPRTKDHNCIPPLEEVKEHCSDPRMRAAIEFLLSHDLALRFRTEDLSQHLNLSVSRLLHLFHEYFGFSPSQALKSHRLHKAQALLSTFKRLKEIRGEIGIPDPSHFVREFKQMYGESPSQMQRRLRGTRTGKSEES